MTHDMETMARGLRSGRTMTPLDQSFHLPGEHYGSPEVYALEKANIFMKDWLCVGRVEEVENPGDYMTLHILDEPVIVARDKDGTLNAFCNSCRHRGVEVAQGKGNLEEFRCPYHGWLYDLSGKLIGAPYMKEHTAFDPATCRLKPVGLDLWAGWIFVTLNPAAPPLREFVSEYEREFSFLRMQDCRIATKFDVELDCNWKLVVENLQDIYHVRVLHIDTFGAHIDTENAPFNVKKERAGFSSFYDAAPDTPTGKTLVGKMPWLEDESMSLGYTGFLWPSFHIFGCVDETHPMVVWPLSP